MAPTIGGGKATNKQALSYCLYSYPSGIPLLRVLASCQRHDREKITWSTPGRGLEYGSISPSLSESINSYSFIHLFKSSFEYGFL